MSIVIISFFVTLCLAAISFSFSYFYIKKKFGIVQDNKIMCLVGSNLCFFGFGWICWMVAGYGVCFYIGIILLVVLSGLENQMEDIL